MKRDTLEPSNTDESVKLNVQSAIANAEPIMEIAHLLKSPLALYHPNIVARVLATGMRRRWFSA